MKIDNSDFGTLAICSIRYCHGRITYMPSLVRRIITQHLSEVTDKDLQVMLNDCDYQATMGLWGDENIDKQGWLDWKHLLETEQRKREDDRQRRNKNT